jgi:hypothetical protein
MVLLLKQYGLVVVNTCNLEFYHFKTFSFNDEVRATAPEVRDELTILFF